MRSLSYWEYKSWLNDIDYAIVGSGIVGLHAAIFIKERLPKAKVLIVERGILPQGASTKNAGFACFGSLSEIIDDLENHDEEDVFNLVKKRWEGLGILRQHLGDDAIDFKHYGGYELFGQSDTALLENCLDQKERVNRLLQPIFGEAIFDLKKNSFGFKNIHSEYLFNKFEGQIDTGKMMEALLRKAYDMGIKILNSVTVKSYEVLKEGVSIKTGTFSFKAKKLLIATNGFASALGIHRVQPARAQVLITEPIDNLKVKGTFHLDRGYYYFRNIDNRILFGGGRNLDFKTEETTILGETDLIQNKLEELLQTTILPDITFDIAHRWSGVMGVGNQKKAIVQQLSGPVFCGVRLGGMGVAIGSLIGKELATIAIENE